MSFHGLIAHFFVALSISLSGRHSLFIHSPTEGHLGCFKVLMIKMAVDICVQVSVWT